MLEAGEDPNFIFSGPPGVGKTTLIEIISFNTRSKLIKLNAVLSSVKELRNEIANAKELHPLLLRD